MSAAAWLAAREARVRRGRAAFSVALVAAAAALATGLELLGRAREAAAALRVDGMGPALRVVPEGVGGSALARLELGEARLPGRTPARVEEVLGGGLRELRPRLVLSLEVGGRSTPVIGAGAGPDGVVELGPALAARLGGATHLRLGAEAFAVGGVREAAGDAEDAAAHVSLAAAQRVAGAAAVNELQVFLRPALAPAAAVARLQASAVGGRVVLAGRGDVADEGIQGTLARGRRLAQVALAAIVGLGLAVAAHLDATERRAEAATLVAIGALPGLVVRVLVLRSLAIGAAGGAAGALLGAATVGLGAGGHGAVVAASWPILALAPLVCAALGGAAAAPAAAALALLDPVQALQE